MGKARADLTVAVQSAALRYGLTPAEVRVLEAIIEAGGGVAPVARLLGLSRSTVKTHIEHLFRKTGARRQAGLVTMVASFGSQHPFRNRS